MGTFKWVAASFGFIPDGAVTAGWDANGSPLYAARAFHYGDLLPGKASPNLNGAAVCYAGNEFRKLHYEVLCSDKVGWKYTRGGNLPPNGIPVGYTKLGERLYMGRVLYKGSLTPGRVQLSHQSLYIPYEDREYGFYEYEILVLSF